VVLMEAMASRTLVVSTRHSGIPELVRHGVTGWLAEEGSVTSLIDILRCALSSRTEWERVRADARAKIEMEFNWEKLAADLLELLCPTRTQSVAPREMAQLLPAPHPPG
jgi:colanic acid/amylovoran biosynthesis glycosyltransferase